jgi:recombinational DNA repair protein (RecF pathway)
MRLLMRKQGRWRTMQQAGKRQKSTTRGLLQVLMRAEIGAAQEQREMERRQKMVKRNEMTKQEAMKDEALEQKLARQEQ